MAHEFCWIELTTDNTEAAKGFYAELFGWGYEESQMEQGTYTMFQPADGPGGGIMAKLIPELPTAWMPYVATDDLEGSVARVEELGGTVHVSPTPVPGHGAFAVIADLRTALRAGRKVRISYIDAKGDSAGREIRPLGIFFWGATATLGAWCELREDFRNFRIDRIESLEVLDAVFASEPGRTLQDYYRAMAERYESDE